MKLRIQDSSVRYRITLKELDILRDNGVLARETRVPGAKGPAVFRYEVLRDPKLRESALVLEPFLFRLVLCESDFVELAAPENEGTYIRRLWTDDSGQPQRFMVFIEKDRPGSTRIKQEAWIYDIDYAARDAQTRPIPGGSR